MFTTIVLTILMSTGFSTTDVGHTPAFADAGTFATAASERILLAGDEITDRDEKANIGDPSEAAHMGDPNQQTTIGDPNQKATIGDPGEKATMGDENEKANIGDPDEKDSF